MEGGGVGKGEREEEKEIGREGIEKEKWEKISNTKKEKKRNSFPSSH